MNIARGSHRLLIITVVILFIYFLGEDYVFNFNKYERKILSIESIFENYPKVTSIDFDDSEVYRYDYLDSLNSGYTDKEIIEFLYHKFGNNHLPAIKDLAISTRTEEFRINIIDNSIGILIISFIFYLVGVVLIWSFKWAYRGFRPKSIV